MRTVANDGLKRPVQICASIDLPRIRELTNAFLIVPSDGKFCSLLPFLRRLSLASSSILLSGLLVMSWYLVDPAPACAPPPVQKRILHKRVVAAVSRQSSPPAARAHLIWLRHRRPSPRPCAQDRAPERLPDLVVGHTGSRRACRAQQVELLPLRDVAMDADRRPRPGNRWHSPESGGRPSSAEHPHLVMNSSRSFIGQRWQTVREAGAPFLDGLDHHRRAADERRTDSIIRVGIA